MADWLGDGRQEVEVLLLELPGGGGVELDDP